jgi:hypothetical protein
MKDMFNLRLIYWDDTGMVFDVMEGRFYRMIRGYILANLFNRSYYLRKLGDVFMNEDNQFACFSHATIETVNSTKTFNRG